MIKRNLTNLAAALLLALAFVGGIQVKLSTEQVAANQPQFVTSPAGGGGGGNGGQEPSDPTPTPEPTQTPEPTPTP